MRSTSTVTVNRGNSSEDGRSSLRCTKDRSPGMDHNPTLYQLEVLAPPICLPRTPMSGPNIHGAPEGTRTPDPRLRRPLLCPPELLAQSGRADLNGRPPAPKAGALPGCATPRKRKALTQALIPLNHHCDFGRRILEIRITNLFSSEERNRALAHTTKKCGGADAALYGLLDATSNRRVF